MNVENLLAMTDKNIIDTRGFATVVDFVIILVITFIVTANINMNFIAAYVICTLVYFVCFESLTGLTVGKFLFKIRVINWNCQKPNFVQSMIRALFWLIEANPIILLCGITYFTLKRYKSNRRLGDRAANTIVVRVSDLRYFLGNKAIQAMKSDDFDFEFTKPRVNVYYKNKDLKILNDKTEFVFDGEAKCRLIGLNGMTIDDIISEVNKGGRFLSLNSQIHFVKGNRPIPKNGTDFTDLIFPAFKRYHSSVLRDYRQRI